MKSQIRIFFIFPILLLLLSLPIIALAQTAKSNCVITKVGSPPEPPPPLPPECQSGVGPNGISYPPDLGAENSSHPGYFKIPPSTNDSYSLYSCENHQWGSKLLIGVLYTVANRWKQKYPQGRLTIGDLNAVGHLSHKWGRAVDLEATTNGSDHVADFTHGNYNRPASIELGQMLVDTDMVLHIWHNDQAVNSAVLDYSNQVGRSKGMVMIPQVNHDNHFHLDVNLDPLLEVWEPGC